MKNLITILLIMFAVQGVAQDTDTTYTSIGFLEPAPTLLFTDVKPLLTIIEPFPTTTIHFTGDSTEFWLNMDGDSLVWGGDMKLTESAKTFINFCDNYWYSKIDSLEYELKIVKNQNKKDE